MTIWGERIIKCKPTTQITSFRDQKSIIQAHVCTRWSLSSVGIWCQEPEQISRIIIACTRHGPMVVENVHSSLPCFVEKLIKAKTLACTLSECRQNTATIHRRKIRKSWNSKPCTMTSHTFSSKIFVVPRPRDLLVSVAYISGLNDDSDVTYQPSQQIRDDYPSMFENILHAAGIHSPKWTARVLWFWWTLAL